LKTDQQLLITVDTGPYRPRVRACIRSVAWHCRIRHNTTLSDICIEWTADTTTFEYNTLEKLVRETAASQPWSAEELITHLKKTLEEKLRREVTVTIRFKENENLEIELTLDKTTT
jgi:hypothetical protein